MENRPPSGIPSRTADFSPPRKTGPRQSVKNQDLTSFWVPLHLNIINSKGRLLEKDWLLGMSLAEALHFATDDFKSNHANYIKKFR